MDTINGQVLGDQDDMLEINIHRQITPTGKISTKTEANLYHKGLKINKKFVDSNTSILQSRLTEQANKWAKEWSAVSMDKESLKKIKQLQNTLKDGVQNAQSLDWDKEKTTDKFLVKEPSFIIQKPILEETYPKINFFDKLIDKIIKTHCKKILLQRQERYEKLCNTWESQKKEFEEKLNLWQKEKKEFEEKQQEKLHNAESFERDYKDGKTQSVEKYFNKILSQSHYPINFTKEFSIEFNNREKMLIIEYALPSKEDLPRVKNYQFTKTTGEIKEKMLSENEFKKLYDEVLYQSTLRTIYEVFKSDETDVLETIVFNGWVNNLNKATGRRQNVCIISLMTSKKEFMDLDFSKVNPKDCFRGLKGVAASELSNITPIPAILSISKEDKRFIKELIVGKNLDETSNIASMDWQDFEHLIREVFGREYSSVGGEVKVTQSSRDLGVDAIAFDPDPIRGGKIIIQAKRYTNTVHIESVRALYGIMQDEGAMKGILVTTSDFGPEAYDFAKNKPISLVNGGNLLAMLHKHKIDGRINLQEAKVSLKDKTQR